MDELITWLKACLDEDQAAAEEMKRVFTTPWELVDRGWMARIVADGPHFPEVVRLEQNQAPGLKYLTDAIYHVLLQDPDRLLREVEAKRELLREHQDTGIGYCGTCVDWMNDHLKWPCRTVRVLALPFSDRPGYQESWRP